MVASTKVPFENISSLFVNDRRCLFPFLERVRVLQHWTADENVHHVHSRGDLPTLEAKARVFGIRPPGQPGCFGIIGCVHRL